MFIIFLALMLILVTSYGLAILILGQLPLPHLYHPNDFFMDLWNVVWMSQTGTLYSSGGLYHPIYAFILRILDQTPTSSPLLLRHQAFFINYLIILIVYAVSVLNFVKNRDRFGWFGSFVICFFSAPLIFLLSRMNLLFVCFILVSVYFYTDHSIGRRKIFRYGVVPLLITSKAYFVVLLFSSIRKLGEFGLILCCLAVITLWSMAGYLSVLPDLSPDRTSLALSSLPLNILNFGGHKQPIYEAVGLNYSVFSYVALAIKLAEINHLPVVVSVLAALEKTKYILLVVGTVFLRNLSKDLNDAAIFLLTVLGLALLLPQIGGYAMVLIIPVLRELDRFLSPRQAALFVAIIFCPVDAGFILGDGPPVLVTQFGPNLFGSLLAHPEMGTINGSFPTVTLSPIRNDISVLALLRPLAIILFWLLVSLRYFKSTTRPPQ